MIVKMIQNLGNRMEKIQETFNKDLEELKSKQTVTYYYQIICHSSFGESKKVLFQAVHNLM